MLDCGFTAVHSLLAVFLTRGELGLRGPRVDVLCPLASEKTCRFSKTWLSQSKKILCLFVKTHFYWCEVASTHFFVSELIPILAFPHTHTLKQKK